LSLTVANARSLRLGTSDGLMSALRTTPLDTIISNDRAFIGLLEADFLI
jgi:hypothetical protein